MYKVTIVPQPDMESPGKSVSIVTVEEVQRDPLHFCDACLQQAEIEVVVTGPGATTTISYCDQHGTDALLDNLVPTE